MKLLITGASGFLGKNLIEELLKHHEHELIAYSTNAKAVEERFKEYKDRIKIITDIKKVDFKEVDILLNLAFPRNSDGIQMAKGLGFIAELFVAANEGGVGAVINISSQSVYSQYREEPATEETEVNLESMYAVGKYATELLLNSICHNIPHTNIRLASLVGVGFNQRIINKLVKKVIDGEEIRIVCGGQKFGYLDVRDAVSGLICLMNSNPKNWHEKYNLGINEAYSIEDIINSVSKEVKVLGERKMDIDNDKATIQKSSHLDCRLFMDTFEWKAANNLDKTVRDIYDDLNASITSCS